MQNLKIYFLFVLYIFFICPGFCQLDDNSQSVEKLKCIAGFRIDVADLKSILNCPDAQTTKTLQFFLKEPFRDLLKRFPIRESASGIFGGWKLSADNPFSFEFFIMIPFAHPQNLPKINAFKRSVVQEMVLFTPSVISSFQAESLYQLFQKSFTQNEGSELIVFAKSNWKAYKPILQVFRDALAFMISPMKENQLVINQFLELGFLFMDDVLEIHSYLESKNEKKKGRIRISFLKNSHFSRLFPSHSSFTLIPDNQLMSVLRFSYDSGECWKFFEFFIKRLEQVQILTPSVKESLLKKISSLLATLEGCLAIESYSLKKDNHIYNIIRIENINHKLSLEKWNDMLDLIVDKTPYFLEKKMENDQLVIFLHLEPKEPFPSLLMKVIEALFAITPDLNFSFRELDGCIYGFLGKSEELPKDLNDFKFTQFDNQAFLDLRIKLPYLYSLLFLINNNGREVKYDENKGFEKELRLEFFSGEDEYNIYFEIPDELWGEGKKLAKGQQ